MCNYSMAKSSLFIFSLFFLLAGGTLLGFSIYAQVYEYIFDRHFLEDYFSRALDNGASPDLTPAIKDYYMISAWIGICLGFILFLTGLTGTIGAVKNFTYVNQYGVQRSSSGSFFCTFLLAFFATGFLIAFVIFAGADGNPQKQGSSAPTKRPDYKLTWKPFDLYQEMNHIFSNCVEFYWTSMDSEERDEFQRDNGCSGSTEPHYNGCFWEVTNTVRQYIWYTVGVLLLLGVLQTFWLLVGCCVSCGSKPHATYVSTLNHKYDNWIEDTASVELR